MAGAQESARTRRWTAVREAALRARHTLTRFPLLIAVGIACAIEAMVVVDSSGDRDTLRLLFASMLGLPLLFALRVSAERLRLSAVARTGIVALGIVPIVLFWLALRGWSNPTADLRWAHFNVGLHLLVAFLPFARTGSLNGFWQYNRILFLRFLLAALYTGVLFAGLAIALLALDNLFGVDVSSAAYARLWFLLAFVFHPWFFLAGVPAELDRLDELDTYPLGLKVFTQFVLIPLVTVYLVILTAYLIRVIVTTTWPSGWIGWLVSSVAAAGTLALLLVHPIRVRADSAWVDAYGRWFYIALLPSIAMLLMAVWLRVDQYGFTERRYLLLALSLWLAGIALFYGITASRNIKVIPMSLCAVALLTLVGPWSAYAVARSSQVSRFASILARHGLYEDERVRSGTSVDVPAEDRRELSAILRYLIRTHGARSLVRIDPAFGDTTRFVSGATEQQTDEPVAMLVMGQLGLTYVSEYESRPESPFFHQAARDGEPVDISGWDLLASADLLQRNAIPIGTDTLVIGPIETGRVPAIWAGQPLSLGTIDELLARLDSAGLSGTPRPGGFVPRELLRLDGEVAGLRVRVLFENLGGVVGEDGIQVHNAGAAVLIDRR